MATKDKAEAEWTRYVWAGAAVLLAIPFVAMRFTREVDWTAFDFLVMGALLATVCGLVELIARSGRNTSYKLGALAGVGASFLITWANLAVGHEHAPYDLYFWGALLVGVAISIASRFSPRGMSAAMLATAAALIVALRVVMVAEADVEDGNLLVSVVSSALIAAPYLVAAWLFKNAARQR